MRSPTIRILERSWSFEEVPPFTSSTFRPPTDTAKISITSACPLGGIAELTRTLTELGESLGYQVGTRVGMHPKVYWKTSAQDGSNLRIKIEVNTFERSPFLEHTHIHHAVMTDWWSGSAEVRTFQLPELMATKVRALYQRAKGRDVFDLWLALTALNVGPRAIAAAFMPYRPENWTPAKAEQNLREKLTKNAYRDDLRQLIRTPPDGFV